MKIRESRHAMLIRWTIALTWTMLLTILLLQSLQNPIIPTGIQPAPPSMVREVVFSTAHGFFFAVTSMVWCWTLHNHMSLSLAMKLSVVGVFFYGVGTEFGQSYTPERSPQVIDLLANGIGVVWGAWAYAYWVLPIFTSPRPSLISR